MDNVRVSVCMSTYNRAHLLVRSLACYASQQFDNDRFELVVVDDSSTDHTAEMVRDWSHSAGIKCTYLTPHPKRTGWRDCAATINMGIRVAQGNIVLLTHPEIMVGRTSVLDCVEKLEEFDKARNSVLQGDWKAQYPIGLYACCKCYYLSPDDQRLIDTCSWEGSGAIAVREIENFYEQEQVPEWRGHPDFSHKATDMVATPGSRIPTWESWILGGHSRETWKRLGGMLPTTKWGACDVGWMHRRRMLGIRNYTCPNESAIVVHQNHNMPGDVETPRVEEDWKRELGGMSLGDSGNLLYPNVNEIGW